MLRSVEVENFFSFFEPTRLSFTVNNKAPKTKSYAESCVEGDRLIKVVPIFGHNGSGKSNLLNAISFLKWFIIESFGEKPDEDFSLQPFLLKERPFLPTKIKVEFECKKSVYRYAVELTSEFVINEELEILSLEDFSDVSRRRFRRLFHRKFDEGTNTYELKASPEFKINEGIRELAKKRKNASVLSAGIFTHHEPSLEIKKYWSVVKANINRTIDRPYPSDYYFMKSTEFYYKDEQLKNKMESIMARSDLGVVGIDIEKVQLPGHLGESSSHKELYMPYGRHSGVNGKAYRLPFYAESGGTKQIYVLLSHLLPILEKGGIAVVDELEADLHPEVLPFLFDLFESPKTNPKRAQLIFTTHAITLFRDLDKYQFVVVEKNKEGMSTAKRIDNLRADDNLFSKYWKGFLGGRPKIEPNSINWLESTDEWFVPSGDE